MNTSVRDAGIPVLTEVIEPVDGLAATTVPPVAAPSFTAPQTSAAPSIPAVANLATGPVTEMLELKAGHEWSKEEWSRLERTIRERILRQILERIDALLEHRIRESMTSVLHTAITGLAGEIKSSLHHSIEDVVTRAVSQEITRLQTTKK
jgi:hypothetical protein